MKSAVLIKQVPDTETKIVVNANKTGIEEGNIKYKRMLTPKSSTIDNGTAIFIHAINVIFIPWSAKIPTAIAFGGVPIGVPIPPIKAEKGMARIKPVRKGSFASNCLSNGITIAIIIAVVAVSDIHIERPAVVSINPSIKKYG